MRMDITGRDPFRELADFLDNWRLPGGAGQTREQPRASNWAPLCDVTETASEIVVTAEIPGMAKEDISLEVTQEALTISGERKFEAGEGRQWLRVERPYGKFSRSFAISVPVDVQKVSAAYKNGLLTVVVPKSEDIQPKKISIQAGE